MISPRSPHPLSRHARRGFSLVELLMVVSIIVLLLGLGAKMVMNPTQTNAVPAAVSLSSTTFSSARAAAITKNARTLVLVNNNRSDTQNYRRQILVIQADKNAAGQDTWSALGNPVMLPPGTFFDRDRSVDTEGNGPEIRRFDYAAGLQEGSGTEWLTYTFAANGASEEAGARFIIAKGTFNPASQDFVALNTSDLGGFVLRRVGHVTLFRDAAQILN